MVSASGCSWPAGSGWPTRTHPSASRAKNRRVGAIRPSKRSMKPASVSLPTRAKTLEVEDKPNTSVSFPMAGNTWCFFQYVRSFARWTARLSTVDSVAYLTDTDENRMTAV